MSKPQTLIQMWKPYREFLIQQHRFYVNEANTRLMSQFDNINADADILDAFGLAPVGTTAVSHRLQAAEKLTAVHHRNPIPPMIIFTKHLLYQHLGSVLVLLQGGLIFVWNRQEKPVLKDLHIDRLRYDFLG